MSEAWTDLRPTRLSRWPALVVGVVWCLLMLVVTIKAVTQGDGRGAALDLAILGVAALGVLRIARQRVTTKGDMLIVHNVFRTRRINRQDIVRIWLGKPVHGALPGGSIGGSPQADAINIGLTSNAIVTVDMTSEGNVEGGKARALQQLRTWHKRTQDT